ncbi:MAG: prepilin peptidase, partial [Alkalicoccus sp.]
MDVISYVYFFTAGLILGSFYNVAGMRLPAGKSVIFPRSHCPRCGHVLSAGELIPVFSYVLLKGKCFSCSAKISPVYPLFELTTGLLFAV